MAIRCTLQERTFKRPLSKSNAYKWNTSIAIYTRFHWVATCRCSPQTGAAPKHSPITNPILRFVITRHSMSASLLLTLRASFLLMIVVSRMATLVSYVQSTKKPIRIRGKLITLCRGATAQSEYTHRCRDRNRRRTWPRGETSCRTCWGCIRRQRPAPRCCGREECWHTWSPPASRLPPVPLCSLYLQRNVDISGNDSNFAD